MKIYAVVSGCYSDFSINALFTKEEDAKKLYELINSGDPVFIHY